MNVPLVLSKNMADAKKQKKDDQTVKKLETQVSLKCTAPTRSERRSFQIENEYVSTSLQTVKDPNLLLLKLKSLLATSKQRNRAYTVQKLSGLIRILNQLLLPVDNHMCLDHDESTKPKGFLQFQEAYDMYSGYQKKNTDLNEFRDILLHPLYGLCVHIIKVPGDSMLLVLDTENCDLPEFFKVIFENMHRKHDNEEFSSNVLNAELVHGLFKTMTSEWDRNCIKFVLSIILKQTAVKNLGIDVDHTANQKMRDRIKNIIEEVQNVDMAAEDLLNLHLKSKESNLTKTIDTLKSTLTNSNLSDARTQDLNHKIESIEDTVKNVRTLMRPVEPYDKQKRQQLLKRKATSLLEENRLKRRKLTNQGPKKKLDSDDEEFIAKSIEDKSTYHGRRHGTCMYTNTRVKKSDLLNIANYRLYQKGKALIKSATTAYNLGKPKNVRSLQAQRHTGKGLFCCKKPPKAEDQDNENTHYQRAHVNNIKRLFFSSKAGNMSKYCGIQSMDDKAYVRPGTSEGFEKCRSGKILTLTDETKARKLPKYDWPEKLVYVTPASHRIFTKAAEIVNGEEKLVTDEDHHFVFTRPKAFVGSSGTVWASETVKLAQIKPEVFELKDDEDLYSPQFKELLAIIHDNIWLYLDMTMEADFSRITSERNCRYRSYEILRIARLIETIQTCGKFIEEKPMEEREKTIFARNILPMLSKIKCIAERMKKNLEGTTEREMIMSDFTLIQEQCRELLFIISGLNIPKRKPRHADFTDAGPGVGVSNFEVKFRDAEIARLHQSDYRIRVHRSRGDSGQGEAERTNSAIGDALVDGGTIDWEHIKKFDGMCQEDIDAMTLEDYESLEKERMEKNAWFVTEQICNRIQDAPVLSQYIQSYVSTKREDMFFFNHNELHLYHTTSKEKRGSVPGSAYCDKIMIFIEKHYIQGELFFEYLKHSCIDDSGEGELCEYCTHIDWIGPYMNRIPQPIPDVHRPGHYQDVWKTAFHQDDGTPRQPDDWQPRANIIKRFKNGQLDNSDDISKFAEEFCVDENHVKAYVTHLVNLKNAQNIRSNDRKLKHEKKMEKKYENYDWERLVSEQKLNTLLVHELDKYLDHHQLPKTGKKNNKVKLIIRNVLRNDEGQNETNQRDDDAEDSDDNADNSELECSDEVEISGCESDDGDEEENIVLAEIGGDISDEIDVHNFENVVQFTTRSGRRATRLNLKKF